MLCVAVLAAMCYAQDFKRPDYETIQQVAQTEEYSLLLQRFQTADTTLTKDEVRTLYYGSIFVGKSSFHGIPGELSQLLNDKSKTDQAAKELDGFLEQYPLDIQALLYRTVLAGRNNDSTLVADLWARAEMIASAIISTGNGMSDSTGWHVVSVVDEYALMDYFFKVNHGNQYLTSAHCDKFDVSVNGQPANLYFDVQALVAWENHVFSPSDKPFVFAYDTTLWQKAQNSTLASLQFGKLSQLQLPKITNKTTVEEYDAYKPLVIECMDWLRSHDPGTKKAEEMYTFVNVYQFILLWCQGVEGCMFGVEKEFFAYKHKELSGYFLAGWAAYFAKTGDNDEVNGRMAGIEAVIDCYKAYPQSLKKDKKKVLRFQQMQQAGTLRQYVIDHIGK